LDIRDREDVNARPKHFSVFSVIAKKCLTRLASTYRISKHSPPRLLCVIVLKKSAISTDDLIRAITDEALERRIDKHNWIVRNPCVGDKHCRIAEAEHCTKKSFAAMCVKVHLFAPDMPLYILPVDGFYCRL
jgi:hypothetical protein